MKRAYLFFSKVVLTSTISYLAFTGCTSDNAVSPDTGDPGTVETQQAKAAGETGATIYKNIASFKQIESFVIEQNEIGALDIPEYNTPSNAAMMAMRVKQRPMLALRKRPDLHNRMLSTAGDSVIFDVTEHNDAENVTQRVSLIYDPETGHARFFVVKFDYPDSSPVEYDSTEVRVDVNGTLLNDTDDMLLSLEHLKRYAEGQLIREEHASYTPDEHAPGTEPEGGVLTNDVSYSASSFISSTSARFEYHVGEGGSYSKTSTFSDNTTHTESATFGEDGNGTFEEELRDGTHISGTFDNAEDGEGGFTKTVTYPTGHDPAQVYEAGEFSYNASTQTLTGYFERDVTPLDGPVQSERVDITQNRVGEVTTTTLNVENADGSSGFITITEAPDVDQAAGEITNADGTFVVFTAQSYPDDSAHLEFQVYADEAAFENGDDPLVTAVLDFYPDGSGRGVVTEGEVTYDVVINPDGSVTATKRV